MADVAKAASVSLQTVSNVINAPHLVRAETRERVESVIAATGYRPGLQAMVGHLGVLDAHGLPIARSGTAAAPGLFFVGYLLTLRGALRDIAMEARRVGRAARRTTAR